MAWQADHPYIMTIIFAAKLGANPQIPGDLQNFSFPFKIAPGMAKGIAACGQPVKRLD